MASNVFDFIVPYSSKKTKRLVVYFVIALDCLPPLLEALYFMAWAEVKIVDDNCFSNALLTHYSSTFKCVPMDLVFDTVLPPDSQLLCLLLHNGDHFSFGIKFVGKSQQFNLSLMTMNSQLHVFFLPDVTNSRPLLWHEHFLVDYIANAVRPTQ